MATFHTTGIVLKVSTSGENDRRASIYTHEYGKLEVFAKSARRVSSKLSPHLESVTLVDCYIARGRVDHLAGIERRERFPALRNSLSSLTHALWAAEVVDVLTRPDHADPRIFQLLEMWFLLAETLDDAPMPETFRLTFVMLLFHYLGHGPQCEHCVRCKSTVAKEWLFSAGDGGLICNGCRALAAPSSVVVPPDAHHVLQTIAGLRAPQFEMYPTLSEQFASRMVPRLLGQVLDRPLATDAFLQTLDFAIKMR
jgi:DNA repair protein RecO (recombination protein O)